MKSAEFSLGFAGHDGEVIYGRVVKGLKFSRSCEDGGQPGRRNLDVGLGQLKRLAGWAGYCRVQHNGSARA